jgi:hypothetical protein
VHLIEVADLDWDQAASTTWPPTRRSTCTAPKKADKRIGRARVRNVSATPGRLVADIDLTAAGTARPEEVATRSQPPSARPNHHPARTGSLREAPVGVRGVIANTIKTILISVDLSSYEWPCRGGTHRRDLHRATRRRPIAGNIRAATTTSCPPSTLLVDFGAPANGFRRREVVVPGVSATARRRKKISEMLRTARHPGADREEPDEDQRARDDESSPVISWC